MLSASIPVVDLGDGSPAERAALLGQSFRAHGFAIVSGHGIAPELIERGWALARKFFALPEESKRRFFDPDLAGARGYTPFGREIAKDAAVHDLKEFWHVGRELEPETLALLDLPGNVWPNHPAGFQQTFAELFEGFDRAGEQLLSLIALDLGLQADWFDDVIENGNSILRLLHYPPLEDAPPDALRAAPHEDINLITLLLGAEEAGLELLSPDGEWLAIDPPAGALVVNIGDMMQRLTNHVLPSTTHRVRNPSTERAGKSRYSMPFFVHPRSDFPIETLPACVSAARPNRYPDPISAGAYLEERLIEIGLRSDAPAND